MPETSPDLPLLVSPAAIVEIRRFCRQRGYVTAQLHLNIAPGGCQGYHYTLDFSPRESPGDQIGQTIEKTIENAPPITIAPEALPALRGATLDYAEDLMGGSFRLQNPPVPGLCACGLSFMPPPELAPPPEPVPSPERVDPRPAEVKS